MAQTLSKDACRKAAQEFLSRRDDNHRGGVLPADCRPANFDDAFAIQMATVEASGRKIGGWKCLVPLDPAKIIVSPILEGTIQHGDACRVQPTEPGKTLIEPEIAFLLGTDLPARSGGYTDPEVDDAIGSCHMALELLQRRYAEDADVIFADRQADCLLNDGIFVGPEITKAKAFDSAEIKFSIDEKSYDGKHPNASAQGPVYWLVNFLSERGIDLKTGQAIITGSYKGAIELPIKTTDIKYENLGQYKVTFKPVRGA